MSRRGLGRGLWIGWLVLFVAHDDAWIPDPGRLVAGLPVGLWYHTLYCVVVTVLMALLVRYAWPRLDVEPEQRP